MISFYDVLFMIGGAVIFGLCLHAYTKATKYLNSIVRENNIWSLKGKLDLYDLSNEISKNKYDSIEELRSLKNEMNSRFTDLHNKLNSIEEYLGEKNVSRKS